MTATPGQNKVYGNADPAPFTYSTGAFQFGDTAGSVLSGALDRAAGENVGSYAIGQNTLVANANYTLTYVGSNFAVTPKALTAVGLTGAVTKVYDGVNTIANLTTANYRITGFVGAEGATIGVATGTFDAGANMQGPGSAVSSAVLSAGSYTPNAGTVLSNYDLSAVVGVSAHGNIGAITPATLTVAAVGVDKVYGAADPALTYTTGAFQFGDNAGSVLSGALSRVAGENVGSYAIGQNTLVANTNYILAYTGSTLDITLSITSKPITPKALAAMGLTSSVNMGGFNIVYRETPAEAQLQAGSNIANGSSYNEFSDFDYPQIYFVRAKIVRNPSDSAPGHNLLGSW